MAWLKAKASIRTRVMEKINPLIAQAEADWEAEQGKIYDSYTDALRVAAEVRDRSLETAQDKIVSSII